MCLFCFIYGSVLPECVPVHRECASCSQRPAEGIRVPGAGVTGACEPPCGRWGSNLGPLEKQPLVLTAEPCPKFLKMCSLNQNMRFQNFDAKGRLKRSII